jgi:DNA ligase (NAD+)
MDILLKRSKKDENSITAEELEELIIYLNDKYYNEEPLVSDQFFDKLVDTLKNKNKNSIIFKKIGAPVRKDVIKKELPVWLGSLDKIKPNTRDLEIFFERYSSDIVISDKLDGISALIEYNDGKIFLYTRGDGLIGQDISYLVPYLSLPDLDKDILIRGELIMNKDIFKNKYSKYYPKARSVVAGIVNAKKPVLEIIRDIRFVAYELIDKKITFISSEQLKIMKKLNFNVVHHEVLKKYDQELFIRKLKNRKENALYEIDGLVITSNLIYHRNTRSNPKYSVAFKVNESGLLTTVLEVEWQASKYGMLIPRLKFEPIILDGDKVQYCTAFNASFIEKNNLGPGSRIRVVKSGDVIPYVTKVVSGTKASFPKLKYHWNDTHINIILDESNDNVLIKKLVSFFKIMEIEGVSEGTIKKLVTNGFEDITTIYEAEANHFLKLPHFQEKSAQKLYNNIHSILDNTLNLAKLMSASLVFGQGFAVKRFSLLITSLPKILQRKEIKLEEVESIDGFSNITAKQFVDNYENFWHWLDEHPFITYEKGLDKINKIEGKYSNQYVVITGFRDSKLEELIKNQGGTVQNNVNSKTTLVLAKNIDQSSSKLKKAAALNIPIREYSK